MQKVVGVVSLVAGVLLLVWAYNISHSLSSQLQQAVTGSPSNRATYFFIGGAVLSIFGLFQIFVDRK
jgi:hypothetical protein